MKAHRQTIQRAGASSTLLECLEATQIHWKVIRRVLCHAKRLPKQLASDVGDVCDGMAITATKLAEARSAEARPCNAKELLENCKVMLSRVAAILAVPDAVDALCRDDVFGGGYAKLLRADMRELKKAIRSTGSDTRKLAPRKSHKPKVVVEITGGVCHTVYATAPVDVTVRDFDNIKEGDKDPLDGADLAESTEYQEVY
jgi:hypothetical protein